MSNVTVTFGDGVVDNLAKMGIDAEKEVNRAIGRQRIKELKKLAIEWGFKQSEESKVPYTLTELHEKVEEKFAELIVKECMCEIQTVKDYKSGHAEPDYASGFDDGMFVAIRTIEEHFGV
jgi:hypothetical protein